MKNTDYPALLRYLLEMGENMLACGGETSRIEGTLSRIGHAYGATRTSVFAITSMITLTLSTPEGDFTQMRRFALNPRATNFSRLEAYNALSRGLCQKPLEVAALKARIEAIEAEKEHPWLSILGHVLGAGSFTLFYAGSLWDALIAGVVALLICLLKNALPRFCSGKLIYHMIIALLTGIAISLICRILPGLHMDKILIGDIMLLIPGVALTSAVRDLLVGDTLAGLMRVVEAMLWAVGLAAGFLTSLLLRLAITGSLGLFQEASVDALFHSAQLLPPIPTLISAFIGSLGFALLYQPRARHLLIGALGGLLAWGLYLLLRGWLSGIFLPCLLSAMAAALYAEILARIMRAPSTIYLLPAIIPLVPGSSLFYAMSRLVVNDWTGAAGYARETLWFTLAIAIGITLSWAIFYALRAAGGNNRVETGL